MKYHYLIIEREYGSGGTEIGNRLSDRSGIPCYGKEILQQLSDEFSIPISQIEEFEEKSTNSFLHSIYLMGKQLEVTDNLLSLEAKLFVEEQRIIKQMIAQGPAIFIGRCAENAVSGRKDVLKVFIKASQNFRIDRAVEHYGIAKDQAENVIHKFDRKRSNFYSVNTGRKWKDFSHYDLVLDSEKLSIEGCVHILHSAMQGASQ